MAKAQDKKLLEEARKRFNAACEADRENREKAQDDLEFVHEPGSQWDEVIKSERGNRPCFEFNKLRVTIKRIVNDIRANRPMGKVRAVEDNDKDTAATLEGLIRNIWACSDADSAVDNAAEYQVAGGMGAWRIVTEYSEDTSWDQDIKIKGFRNPMCLYADPASQDHMKRDARYWFVTSKISKQSFEAKYGTKGAVDFEDGLFDDEDDWDDEEGDSIRIAEYWYKTPIVKHLALLSDGSTIDADEVDENRLVKVDENGQPQQLTVVKTRQVNSNKIQMVVMSGDRILEGPTDWAGTKFPFILVYGENVILDGKVSWFGLTRFAKDAQRAYNFSRTLAMETIALTPLSVDWATPAMAQGHTEMWARAHKELMPFRLYNPDPATGGRPPERAMGANIPQGLMAEMQISSDDIKSVTGIFDNSLGQHANESSGVAIRARQAQGEIATFNFSDNVARAIRYTWELLIDLVPMVYDTERSVRILGTDGAEQYAKVNAIDPQTNEVVNDLSRGKFDVTVTSGPSFSTQRQEAAEVYMGLAQANPAVFAIAGDLIFKSLDLPYSEDMAERWKSMLPPQIQQMLQAKSQNGGKPMPPEVMQAMQQAQQAMQRVQQQGQMVQQAAQEAEGTKAEAEKATSQLQAQQAKLNADYQRMLADIAKKEAGLVMKEAQLVLHESQAGQSQGAQEVASDREALSSQVQQALAAIQQQAAQFMQQSAQVIAQIQANSTPQVVVANEPRQKVVRVKRINGELVGTVEES